MATLSEALKKINKRYETAVISNEVKTVSSYGTLSLGSPSLDFILYNSFPEGKIIEFCGKESSGKTTASFFVAASYQRRERVRHPDNPRGILYVDLERTADKNWAKLSGYDMDADDVKTWYFTPNDSPAEVVLSDVIDIVKTGEIGFVIIDSLNMLVPQQVFNDNLEKKEMGGIAKVLGDFVRRITPILSENFCTLIGIQQGRDNVTGYGNPFTTSGGNAWKAGCSVRLMIKRGAPFDEDGTELKSSAENPAGYVMEVAVLKTKVCKWDRRLGRMHINYNSGVDTIQDTIEVATFFGLIDNSTQGTFKIVDLDTGEIAVDENGDEVKIRGKKNIKPYFLEHPTQFKKLYDKTYEILSRKDDPNVVSFERLLNVNIAETFGMTAESFEQEMN